MNELEKDELEFSYHFKTLAIIIISLIPLYIFVIPSLFSLDVYNPVIKNKIYLDIDLSLYGLVRLTIGSIWLIIKLTMLIINLFFTPKIILGSDSIILSNPFIPIKTKIPYPNISALIKNTGKFERSLQIKTKNNNYKIQEVFFKNPTSYAEFIFHFNEIVKKKCTNLVA